MGDLGRRLASSSATIRAAETARDDALREASWLRCELSTFQRLEQDRKSSSTRGGYPESDSAPGRQPWSTVAENSSLHDRSEHDLPSDALEFTSRGRLFP